MNKEITFSNLIKTIYPSIIMMLFLSLYTIIDGVFVSRLIGTDALSAINIAFPFVNFLLGVSIMLASGGCAIVMKNVGEGKHEEAKGKFTNLIITAIAIGLIIMVVAYIFLDTMIIALGSTDELYDYCYEYIICFIIFTIPTILKSIVEQFLVAINKAPQALLLTVMGGILNVLLDYVFISIFDWGLVGAGVATGLGYSIPAFIGLLFFINKNNTLHFTKVKHDMKFILSSCYNGSSEMVTQLSNGLITFLFNITLLQLVGENGVAGITIILYVQFSVNSIFMGYSIGIAPKISYFYGEGNKDALKRINNISFKFITVTSVVVYLLTITSAEYLVMLFTERDSEVFDVTLNGLLISSKNFLISGANIFTISMFTALGNGKISAILSFMNILVFQSFAIIFFAMFFGIDGVWEAVPFSQFLGIIMSMIFYNKYQKVYGY